VVSQIPHGCGRHSETIMSHEGASVKMTDYRIGISLSAVFVASPVLTVTA
jgi:hypothetical protein